MTNICIKNIRGIFYKMNLFCGRFFFRGLFKIASEYWRLSGNLLQSSRYYSVDDAKSFACCILQNRRRLPTTKAYTAFFFSFIWRMRNHAVRLNVCLCVHFFYSVVRCECVLEAEHDAWAIARRGIELSNRMPFRCKKEKKYDFFKYIYGQEIHTVTRCCWIFQTLCVRASRSRYLHKYLSRFYWIFSLIFFRSFLLLFFIVRNESQRCVCVYHREINR